MRHPSVCAVSSASGTTTTRRDARSAGFGCLAAPRWRSSASTRSSRRERIPWNRVGQTHFSFEVRNIHKWHDHLKAKGAEIVSTPEQSPRGHWFFFVRDFDGNLIEMIDLRHMYYVLRWLGPLGGWLFRRGMYREYYQRTPNAER